MLPAVPGSIARSTCRSRPGENVISLLRIASPRHSASQAPATARTAAICWGASPGFGRFCRIRVTVTGVPEIADNATARRRTCPPPSR